jgi:hypothetical protein
MDCLQSGLVRACLVFLSKISLIIIGENKQYFILIKLQPAFADIQLNYLIYCFFYL